MSTYEWKGTDENIFLVFRWLDCVENCPEKFQVYSPNGKYSTEVLIEEGEYDLDIVSNWDKLVFTDKGIFAMVQLKNNLDSFRLIKVNY